MNFGFVNFVNWSEICEKCWGIGQRALTLRDPPHPSGLGSLCMSLQQSITYGALGGWVQGYILHIAGIAATFMIAKCL